MNEIKIGFPHGSWMSLKASISFLVLVMAFNGSAQTTNPPPNVWAWGDNSSGQCDVPASVTNAVAIAAGSGFSMALKADGTVVTWGTTQDFGFQVTNAVQIAAGGNAAWVLLADGSYHVSQVGIVNGGGANGFQMHTPTQYDIGYYVIFPTISTITNVTSIIAAGSAPGFSYAPGSFAVLSKADGTTDYAGAYPWGGWVNLNGYPGDSSDQLSFGASFSVWLLSTGSVGASDGRMTPYSGISSVPNDLTNVVFVAANAVNPIALKSNGTLESWGGFLPKYGSDTRFVDYNVGISNIIAIAGNQGATSFLALRSDGVVIDTTTGTTACPSLPFATAISLGATHALALVNPSVTVTAPAILQQPQSQTVPINGTVYLECGAVGFGHTTYQWYFNQTNLIYGATNNFLAITNMQPQQSGAYTLVASNAIGSTTSMPASISVVPVLAVNMVPAITMFGGVGTSYRLDYINQFGSTNAWLPLSTVTLTSDPQLFFDTNAIGQSARFYRLVQVP